VSATAEPDWGAIARSPEFRELIANRRRFLVAATTFYCAYLLAFLCLLAFAPDAMNKTPVGSVTWALLLGMSLVVLAIGMAVLHARRAPAWDALAERVVAAARPPADEARFAKAPTSEAGAR
jgi:uncharacterized membrane protein (DUF485 family)